MSKLVRPYEISVWKDVWGEEGFVESRICTIGSESMLFDGRAQEPSLTRNINGTNKLTFKMYKQCIDKVTGEKIPNPFIEYLTNERKVKLLYKNKQYDFIIKNSTEDSNNLVTTYQCEDANIQELSKNGFSVELSEELQNNSGTIQELATKILEGTDWEVESEISVEVEEDSLVHITIPAGQTVIPVSDNEIETNGVSAGTPFVTESPIEVLAFYSSCRNSPYFFQFIYKDGVSYDKQDFAHNEKGVITDKNCQYYIVTLDPSIYEFCETDEYNFYLPKGVKVSNVDTIISPYHRGGRYNFSQQTVFEPKLNRYVNIYQNEEGVEYRGYETTEYIVPELVQNFITNTEFKNTSGWIGAKLNKDSDKAKVEAVFGRFGERGFISAVKELNTDESYTSYLKLIFDGSHQAVFNSCLYDNRTNLGYLEVGSEWMLEAVDQNGASLLNVLNFELQEYKYDASGGIYREYVGLGESTVTFTAGANGRFIVSSNTYPTKKDFTQKSQVRLKITPKTNIGTFYIKEIRLFRVYYNADGELIRPNKATSELSGDTCIQQKYCFYTKQDLDAINDKEEFAPKIVLDVLDTSKYIPQFSANAEKIRSVSVKESNYFNNLQTLAEKFEMWMRIKIERDDAGKVIRKLVRFENNVGKLNYANIRYGVNLKDIKRTFESKSLTTKLIVKTNSNEFATNGFCTVARAKNNPTGENFLYDFRYYYDAGLIDEKETTRYLYSLEGARGGDIDANDEITNAQGYYPRLRKLNDRLAAISDEITALSSGLLKLKAEHELATQTNEAALKKMEDAADNIYFLTNIDVANASKDAFDAYSERSDVQKELEQYIVYSQAQKESNASFTTLESNIANKEQQINELVEEEGCLLNIKTAINQSFFSKYARFIQEGTWVNEEYNDDEKYYLDAQSTLYNSCYPKVTYSINMVALSQIPGYELFDFALGDRTFVEDEEFFGKGILEQIVITEQKEEIESPEKDSIKVQNFKNQFQDLFQKITATTQSAQLKEGITNKAINITCGTTDKKTSFLEEALSGAAAAFKVAGQQSVRWGSDGITVTDTDSPCNQIRLIGGAIMLSNQDENGEQRWTTAITSQGISASVLTAGIINTEEISIVSGNDATFRWDAFGLSAFDKRIAGGVISDVSYNKFVRFDSFGLYGVSNYIQENGEKIDGRTWKPATEEEIDEYASFSLTWDGLKVSGRHDSDVRVVAKIGKIQTKTDNATINSIIHIVREEKGKEDQVIFSITNDGKLSLTGAVINQSTGVVGGWIIGNGLLKSDMTKPNVVLGPYGVITKDMVVTGSNPDTPFILRVGTAFGISNEGKVYSDYIFVNNIHTSACPATLSPIANLTTIEEKYVGENLVKYENLFDSIAPAVYAIESQKNHFGFHYEQLNEALNDVGLTEEDFSAIFKDYSGLGRIRYEEFIALNTWQIQKLKARVKELEDKLN